MSIYGFKEDKCKVEVLSKKEVNALLRKVDTQSLVYTNTTDGIFINVCFKRSGNVVECIVQAKVAGEALYTRTSSEFVGEFPSWAKPDMSFSKQHIHFGDNQYKGGLSLLLYKNGSFSIMYNNLYEEETTFLLQFTYIVDDDDTAYELGDVDGNGVIDEVDLGLVQNYIMGLQTLSNKQFQAADINGDGEVTSSDYVLLQQMISNEEAE